MQAGELFDFIRMHLNHPPRLGTPDMVLAISSSIGLLQSQMRNTNERWFPGEYVFSPATGQSTFSISIPDYAKVISVEWINPYVQKGSGLPVDVVDWERLNDVYLDPPNRRTFNDGTRVDGQAIIRAIAFQGIPPSLTVRVTPIPTTIEKYKIYYDKVKQVALSGTDSLDLPLEYWHLVAAMAAEMLIPNCPTETQESVTRSVSRFLNRSEDAFQQYIQKSHKVSSHRSKPYRIKGGWSPY